MPKRERAGPRGIAPDQTLQADEEPQPGGDRDAQDRLAVVHIAAGHRFSMGGPNRPKVS